MKVSCDVWQTKHRAFILLTTALISGISVVRAYAQDDTKSITVYVDPGVSYNQNVGAGFDLIEKEATVLNIHLAISKGTIIESHLISVASGANWSKVSGSETDWQCAGVGPNDDFWCVIMCLIGGPGEGGPTYRWMSVSDVDVDADTDNNNFGASHRPPSRSEDEDHSEYPGILTGELLALVVPINDDNDVSWDWRDGWSPMDRDCDPDVLDFALEIHPKHDGAWGSAFPNLVRYLSDGTSEPNSTNLGIDEFATLSLCRESYWNATSGDKSTGMAAFLISAPAAGAVPTDKMQYLTIGCDIDVDGTNDGSIEGANGFEWGEDFLEAHPQDHSYLVSNPEYKFGMFVDVNDNDDDGNGNPDNGWDGTDWDGPDGDTIQGGSGSVDEMDLGSGILRGLGVGQSDKYVMDATLQPILRVEYLSGTGAVRLFTSVGHYHIGVFDEVGDVQVEYGGSSAWEQLYSGDEDILVEGLRPGEVVLDYELVLNGAIIHQDKVRITVLQVDLDTDSDNDGTVEPNDSDEDAKENADDEPGKRIFVNKDDDNKNGKADTEDDDDAYSENDNDFAEIQLNISENGMSILAGHKLYLIADAGLNIWSDRQKTPLPYAANPPSGSSGTGDDETADIFWWDIYGGSPTNWTFHVEGTTTGTHYVQLQLRKSDGTIISQDIVKISVEKMVWPNQDPAADWDATDPTSEWNGFELPEGWFVSSSLCNIINGTTGYIRTEYPEETSAGRWEGTTNQNSYAELDLATVCGGSWNNNVTVRIEITYAFEQSPNIAVGDFVDTNLAGRYQASFFHNSGIKIENRSEIQIFDTASLLDAIDGSQETIDGVTASVIGDASDINARGVVQLDHGGTAWTTTEADKVESLISGTPYAVDTRMDGETYMERLQRAPQGGQTMTIDVFRENDGEYTFTITINGSTKTYNNIVRGKPEDVISNKLMMQSHWGSGVKFTSAKVKKL